MCGVDTAAGVLSLTTAILPWALLTLHWVCRQRAKQAGFILELICDLGAFRPSPFIIIPFKQKWVHCEHGHIGGVGARLHVPASPTSTDSWRAPSSPAPPLHCPGTPPLLPPAHLGRRDPGPAVGTLTRQPWAPWVGPSASAGDFVTCIQSNAPFTNRDLTEAMQTLQARRDAPTHFHAAKWDVQQARGSVGFLPRASALPTSPGHCGPADSGPGEAGRVSFPCSRQRPSELSS